MVLVRSKDPSVGLHCIALHCIALHCRVSSVECRVSSVECRVSSVECRVSSVECRVSSVEQSSTAACMLNVEHAARSFVGRCMSHVACCMLCDAQLARGDLARGLCLVLARVLSWLECECSSTGSTEQILSQITIAIAGRTSLQSTEEAPTR
jgi:hypothetical protein